MARWLIAVPLAALALGCSDDAPPPETKEEPPPTTAPDPFVDKLTEGARILWIAAHPDDEIMTGALFGELGVERRLSLHFMLMTRGEKSTSCLLPEGCLPDIATVREGEMQSSANMLQGGPAEVVQLGFPDAAAGSEKENDPSNTVLAWQAFAGGPAALIDRVRTEIERINPGVIVFQDPRHGATCHPDHRAAAYVVIETLMTMGASAPSAYMVENSQWVGNSQVGFDPAAPNDPALIQYDGTRFGPIINGEVWGYEVGVVASHPSQFPENAVEWAMAAPPEHKQLWYLEFDGSWPSNTDYDICTVAFGHGPVMEGTGGSGGGGTGGSGGGTGGSGGGGTGGSGGN